VKRVTIFRLALHRIVQDAGGGLVSERRVAHGAERLPNGNTLISDTGHDRVIEVDIAHNIVWNSQKINLSDESSLDYPNDADRLSNGNTLISKSLTGYVRRRYICLTKSGADRQKPDSSHHEDFGTKVRRIE
jgi:hypothetical protein